MNELSGTRGVRYARVGQLAEASSLAEGAAEAWIGSVQDLQSPLRLPSGEGQRGARAGLTPGDRKWHLRAKRVFDILASGTALIALAPLFLLVAALIKVSSAGPVFFRQEREGYLGAPFTALKFRSMRLENCDLSGVKQTTKDDPRVTAIGRFIRRTSIDELPQLINVLRGEMSLVGPRPHVYGMQAGGMDYKRLVPYYDQRLAMLPGLTGWAQANGLRGPTDSAERARARVDYDIAYIENFSFWHDLQIIFLTIRHEFIGGTGH